MLQFGGQSCQIRGVPAYPPARAVPISIFQSRLSSDDGCSPLPAPIRSTDWRSGRCAEGAPPGRRGKKALIGYFDPSVSKQLKQLALDEDSTVQQLLGEALDLLFQARGKPQIVNGSICCAKLRRGPEGAGEQTRRFVPSGPGPEPGPGGISLSTIPGSRGALWARLERFGLGCRV